MMTCFRCRLSDLTVAAIASLLLIMPAAASESLNEQLQIRTNNATQGLSRDVADQLLRLGQQEVMDANYRAAIAAWYRAIEIYTLLGDFTAAGIAYDYIGNTYTDMGRYTAAEDVIRRRIGIAQDYNDFQGQVYGYNNLGNVFIQSGYLNQAQEAFEVGLAIATDIQDPAGMGLSYSNLGLVARLQGNLEAASTYYEFATNYRLQAGDWLGQAHSSNSLGQIYRQLGREGSALGAFLVARRASREADHVPTLLPALDGLIDLYRDRGDLTTAWDYLQERMAITDRPDATPAQKLGTLLQLGQYYEQVNRPVAAEAAYEQALELAEALTDPRQKTFLLNRLHALRWQVEPVSP